MFLFWGPWRGEVIHLELLGAIVWKTCLKGNWSRGKQGKSKETQTNTEVMVTLLSLGSSHIWRYLFCSGQSREQIHASPPKKKYWSNLCFPSFTPSKCADSYWDRIMKQVAFHIPLRPPVCSKDGTMLCWDPAQIFGFFSISPAAAAFLWLVWMAPAVPNLSLFTPSSLVVSGLPPDCPVPWLQALSKPRGQTQRLAARHPRLLFPLFPFLLQPCETFLHPRSSLPLFLILATPLGLSGLGSSHTLPKSLP